MNYPKIRTAILDDNPKFRKSLGELLGNEADIDVVAEAEINLAGIREVEKQKPDVILMDSNKPFTDGLETTEMIVSRYPETKIIVLSMQSKSTMTLSSCRTWACYPLCENCSPKEILAAIRDGFPGVEDAAHEMNP
jgi:two-component system, NarL family, response regulator DegU